MGTGATACLRGSEEIFDSDNDLKTALWRVAYRKFRVQPHVWASLRKVFLPIMSGKQLSIFFKSMKMNITEEQKQQLQGITIANGTNAWEYVMQQSEETQHWIAAGILSCVKKGRILNRMTIFWEAEDLRNPPKKDERPMCQHELSKELKEKLTEEQLQQIQKLTLSSGMSAWSYVLSCDEDAQYWVALGILSCVEHDYGLNKLVINWEARELRYKDKKRRI